MQKIISALALLSIMGSICASSIVSAAPEDASQLEILAPTTARVGEAIDITVRAVDTAKSTVIGYRGSIIFNTDAIGDTVPAPGKTIAFTADDNGEKKFSKGLIFKKSGKQKIYATDVSDDIIGEATINVEPASTTPVTNDASVTIITPENDTKIGSDMVMISGKSRKNSKVIIKLNGQEVGSANTDDSGIFTKNLTSLTQENNIVTASLIDGANTVLATSPETQFSRVLAAASTYGITISPSTTVEASSPIDIVIDATPGLAEISITIDGALLVAREEEAGKYMIKTIAPLNAWVYNLPITQKDTLGQVKNIDSTTRLTVTAKLSAPVPIPTFKNIKTTTTGSRIVFEFGIENPPLELSSFNIAYGKNADSLSQEVTTMDMNKIVSKTVSGAYTWYIDKIPADTYTFKIFGRSSTGVLISGIISEPIVATIGTSSCTIGNVEWLTVSTDSSKSLIAWWALTGATSYNLYKVSAAGDYTLFQNTTDPNYTLYLSSGAVTYENFAVKALCDTKIESKEYSKMSRVQSGPGMIAIVVIVAALLGAILMRRRSI